jgi:hypothetical protein
VTIFTGFTFDTNWQSIADEFDLSESNIMAKVNEYSDTILPLTDGTNETPEIQERIDEFILFISFAASTGHPIAVALSCFIDFEDDNELTSNPFKANLPIPVESMDEDAREFMVTLYERLIGREKSENGTNYLINNIEKINEIAESGDVKMLFLYGLAASADGQPRELYRQWYEQAALGGYELAYYHVAGAFDGGSIDSDWGKVAYWNYQGAKVENKNGLWCCYNLGIIYALGDFVKQDLTTASFYLSLAYRNAHKTENPNILKNLVVSAMKEHSIKLQEPPYFLADKEMDPQLAELSDIY